MTHEDDVTASLPAAPEPDEPSDAMLRPGDRVGRYVIRSRIGEGGFGDVYLAEQTEPVERRVALKIIKLGMDTREVVARFRAELQTLALMDHPNVATVFDAGATATGRPYFVMEHVPGIPITTHCDNHRLSIDERLALFCQVCDALQHAHQKGVIHRDIKPSNVLVMVRGEEPVAKVIDFGIARAIDRRRAEMTLFTQAGQLVGTPEYMSPEQAEMNAQDIDTRSDVYSLGVLLYELLSGTLPFDSTSLRRAALAEVQRIIRETEPVRPSTRLSSIGEASAALAARRRVNLKVLRRELRGDLDWITMKAMEKDRTRRYASASELAADVRRHLHSEPVLAGPPSAAYRLRKFVRRNRTGVVAATLVVAALLAGIAGTTAMALVAHERSLAFQRQAEITAAVNDFLNDAFAQASPARLGRDATVRDVMDVKAAELDAGTMTPRIEATFRHTIGATYNALGDPDQALRHLERSVALHEAHFGPAHRDTIEARGDLAGLLRDLSRFDEAASLFDDAIGRARRSLGDTDRLTLALRNGRAVLEEKRGRREDAEAMQREILDLMRKHLGPRDALTLQAMNNLAAVRWALGDAESAIEINESILRIRRDELGSRHPQTIMSMNNLGNAHLKRGDVERARALLEEGLGLADRHLGATHPTTLLLNLNLGNLWHERRDLARAVPYWRACHEGYREKLGDDHKRTVIAAHQVGIALLEGGDPGAALPYFEQAAQRIRTIVEPSDWLPAGMLTSLGRCLTALDRLDEADEALTEAHEWLQRPDMPDDRLLRATLRLAQLRRAQVRHDEALALLDAATALAGPPAGADRYGLEAHVERAECRAARGDVASARALAETILPHLEGSPLLDARARALLDGPDVPPR